MMPMTAGVTAPATISQGITFQINSVTSEPVGSFAWRRDRWLITTVSNVTTKSAANTVMSSLRIKNIAAYCSVTSGMIWPISIAWLAGTS